MKNPVVVVGSGLGGYLFAKEFRQHDKERPLIILTMTDGRFYSKPLLSTALTHKKNIHDLTLANADAMSKQLSAEIITYATVTSIQPREKIVSYKINHEIKTQVYGDLVLACGADKICLSLQGNGVDEIHSVNNIEDYESFREWITDKKHIAIIGAGLVGCEFANDLVNNGYQVTIITLDTYPLARWIPEPAGHMLREVLAKKGVQWILGRSLCRVDKDDSNYVMILDDNTSVKVDGVMSAVGLRPILNLAQTAKLETNIGIIVDTQLRTSDPHIYALGDCAEINGECRQYIAPLLQSARALARVLSGEDFYCDYPVMPIVVKTPACPAVVVPPPRDKKGEWFYEGEDGHLKAIFKGNQDQLYGFALLGDRVREKINLIEQMTKK